MFAISLPCSAETRSGFWTLMSPSSDVRNLKADFSKLTPFCSNSTGSSQCSLDVADVDFSGYQKVLAPGGIMFDSALGTQIQTEYLSGRTISLYREGLFYLDSMMKKRGLTAPTAGYADSCPLNKDVYFLKTSEGRSAVMLKVGEYFGGIDRTYYYWAYRPEDDGILHKTALFETPESLSITVDAFSGRPNPVFILRDSAGIAEIVHQIYVSVNTLLDSSVKRTGELQCFQGLGYRKMTVSGMFGPGDVPYNSDMPTLEICNAIIMYYKVSPFSSVIPPQLLYDPQQRLEKLIIRVCCRLGLTVTDSLGEIQFCALIPDSLKDFDRVQTDRRTGYGGGFDLLRLSKDKIILTVPQTGNYSMEILDMRGRRVSVINRRFDRGEHTVKLDRCAMGAGVYLVRLRMGNSFVATRIPLIGY